MTSPIASILANRCSNSVATTTKTAAAATTKTATKPIIPSFGFSGAGFLTCYHIGVAQCLIQNGLLPKQGQISSSSATSLPIMTGVSGGALVAAATAIGLDLDICMDAVLEVARRTRKAGGVLDALRPGFSLIDEVEDIAIRLAKDVDNELLLRRIDHGRLLRIGLTDRRDFELSSWVRKRLPYQKTDGQLSSSSSYVYVDQYRDFDDILATIILSSYIPGITGPALGSFDVGSTVHRSHQHLQEMVSLGFVKTIDGRPIAETTTSKNTYTSTTKNTSNVKSEEKDKVWQQRERFWDGGLSNAFPIIDGHTCIVSPFIGNFVNPSISPNKTKKRMQDDLSISDVTCMASQLSFLSPQFFANTSMNSRSSALQKQQDYEQSSLFSIHANEYVQLNLCLENVETVRRVSFSSEDTILEKRYEQGYNDARKFLWKQNLLHSLDYSIPVFNKSKHTNATPNIDVTTSLLPQQSTALPKTSLLENLYGPAAQP